jgi:16S rRNA (guanine527-N7)-methyltransferase
MDRSARATAFDTPYDVSAATIGTIQKIGKTSQLYPGCRLPPWLSGHNGKLHRRHPSESSPVSDTPADSINDSDTLPAALARSGIDLADDQVERLDHYCRLLWEWNEKLNLTRHTTYEKFTSRDVVDSQALEQFLDSGSRVLDVGTGGGVPGIVLAILRPDLSVELCDSVAKKAKAVQAIVSGLGLDIPVHHAPVQQILADHSFEELVVRAVAPLANLLTWLAPHWEAFERLLVIKGPAWTNERLEARERGLLRKLELRKIYSYPLPGTSSESVVLSITRREA